MGIQCVLGWQYHSAIEESAAHPGVCLLTVEAPLTVSHVPVPFSVVVVSVMPIVLAASGSFSIMKLTNVHISLGQKDSAEAMELPIPPLPLIYLISLHKISIIYA